MPILILVSLDSIKNQDYVIWGFTFPFNIEVLRYEYDYNLSFEHFVIGSSLLPLMNIWVVSSFFAVMYSDYMNVLLHISFCISSEISFEYIGKSGITKS